MRRGEWSHFSTAAAAAAAAATTVSVERLRHMSEPQVDYRDSQLSIAAVSRETTMNKTNTNPSRLIKMRRKLRFSLSCPAVPCIYLFFPFMIFSTVSGFFPFRKIKIATT